MAKSVEVKLNEALAALKLAGKTKLFESKLKPIKETAEGKPVPIEEQLTLAEKILKDEGIVRESTPIKKNNGAVDTFVEGNPFGRTAEEFSPGYVNSAAKATAKSQKVLADGLLRVGGITEAEHRKWIGAKPEGYEKLSEQQRKDFDFARLVGISEADAFKVAKLKRTDIKEVSRR